MPGWIGFAVNGVACAYMLVWFVIYCFPYFLPTDSSSMNYASLIWGGLTMLVSAWWLFGVGEDYEGPTTTGGFVSDADVMEGAVKDVTTKQGC